MADFDTTTWSTDSLTKATETTSTNNNVTLGGTLAVTGATTLSSTLTIGVNDTGYDVKFFGATSNSYMLWDESADALIIGANVDGTDRSIIFGHSTLQSIIGIDDDQDVFAINTDGAFESNNDLEIDTSGNMRIQGDLTVTGNNISSSGGTPITFSSDNVIFADNIYLRSNGSVLGFGASDDVLLYHQSSGFLTIKGNTSVTNGILAQLRLRHETSGTPSAGIGTSIQYEVETSSGNVESGMQLSLQCTDVSSGAEDFDFIVELMESGSAAAERMRLTHDGKLRLEGNVIQASDGGDTITMDTSDNVTIAGNLTAGLLVAKTYKPETIFAFNLAATGALSSGTEYFMIIGGNPLDGNDFNLSATPEFIAIETALCDFTIERLAVNFYTAQSNVTSIEIRLKNYDGSGDLDDASNWDTVGTAATVQGSGTLSADTRVVQTPTDWVTEKNEIWGLTIEYTLESGTVGNVQINGGILMLQDWSDIIANT